LNLTEGTARRIIMPDGKDYPVERADGLSLRGFDLHDEASWKNVLDRMRPGRVYLATVSKPGKREGYKVLHYHVAIMLPDDKGGVWLYHATRLSKTHSMDIKTREGLNRFLWELRRTRNEPKQILIVESIPYPQTALASAKDEVVASPTKPKTPGNQARAEGLDVLDTLGVDPVAPTRNNNNPPGAKEPPPTKPETGPDLVINHLSGRVYGSHPDLSMHIPKFIDNKKEAVGLWFRNDGDAKRQIEILMEGPDGRRQVRRLLQPNGKEAMVRYPQDFGLGESSTVRKGKYKMEVSVDGSKWSANVFDVNLPREAAPKILEVKGPASVTAGQTFSLKVVAENQGAESDYGGITVSCPDPAALRIETAKPGKVFKKGSTVLSVTTDRIQISVPMAEQWIELWGEGKRYEMTVGIKALRSGTFPIYVRCAIRGVNVKSSVVLMDPPSGRAVDQQGFPVYVHNVAVR
jgi:hypothetical protein